MNPAKTVLALAILCALSAARVPAQTNTTATGGSGAFDTTGLPQWVKDMRRWEIVAFGSIPFTMLTASFVIDMYRWSQANGMDFSEPGRRYAPWPLKSAGAVAMDGKEVERTLILAASLSVTIAVIDQIIVQVKRHKARKRAESLPAGTTILTRTPLPEEEEAPGEAEAAEAAPDTAEDDEAADDTVSDDDASAGTP